MTTYFLMKVRGKAKIPDYIQLRDANMTLIGYFRPGRGERLEKVVKNEDHAKQLKLHIEQLQEFGKIIEISL